MGVCASLAACLCFPVCLCLLCFEANKYDDDDDDWCVRGNWSTLDTRESRRAQNAGVSERQQISRRPRRARFIVLLVTTATARAVHSRATLHHFAAAAAHLTHNKLQRSPTDPRDALRCVRRVVHTLGLLVGVEFNAPLDTFRRRSSQTIT